LNEKEYESKWREKELKKIILNILRGVRDPELNASLVEYGLIKPEFININEATKEIEVMWFPTTPFCPLILHISAIIRYILLEKFINWKVKIKLHPDVIGSEMWNEKLSDEKTLDSLVNEIKERGWLEYFYSGEQE